MAWLNQLQDTIDECQNRWELSLGQPWIDDARCSWVAPAVRRNGTRAVLKLGMPHMEAAHEIDGLRFWKGEPTVRLYEADSDLHAMLLERCEPGTSLRELPDENDLCVARNRRVCRNSVIRAASERLKTFLQEGQALL